MFYSEFYFSYWLEHQFPEFRYFLQTIIFSEFCGSSLKILVHLTIRFFLSQPLFVKAKKLHNFEFYFPNDWERMSQNSLYICIKEHNVSFRIL